MKLTAMLVALSLAVTAQAKTLQSITILPPADGYHISSTVTSAQLSATCTYTDAGPDACVGVTLTWGSADPGNLSVNSSGLVTFGVGDGGAIASIVRSGNLVTVTTTSSNLFGTLNTYNPVTAIIRGVTDSSFNGVFPITVTGPNTFTYSQTGVNASSSGGAAYDAYANPDIYAYNGTILGHHPVRLDGTAVTAITVRPETASNTIVQGTTVLVSALDTTSDPIGGAPLGDYCAWTSANPAIATVNNIGEVTGVAAGTTNITCTFNSHTASRTVNVTNPTITTNIWYVRPDGGTVWTARVNGQCNGTANAPYPGSGTNQNCAVSSPMYCFTDESSSTVYTGIVQPGDTCLVVQGSTPYKMNGKTPSTNWITNDVASGGAVIIPSGTPAQHTKLLGANYAACSSNSARTQLQNYYGFITLDLRGQQNVDIGCIDLSNYADCTANLTGVIDFTCPNGQAAFPFMADSFSANINLTNSGDHGFYVGWAGTPGPGLVVNNFSDQMNAQSGLNFDDPFGYNGNRSDGFTATQLNSSYNGCTNELDKSLASVSRDGAGNLTVNFAANQIVNYLAGNNIVLSAMTPSDLNGTFPVTSIPFNQQTVSITGGSCIANSGSATYQCTLTTSTNPAFGIGAFVKITGASPSWLNKGFEIYSTDTNRFSFNVSASATPGAGVVTVSSGGTASTASSLTATAAGSAESATVVGTASHVIPAHRCMDQNDGAFANGDGVGTGSNTIGSWKCDKCTIVGNLQDGWDMLHSAMIQSVFTNSLAAGNEGATAKFGNADTGTVDNNILVANCASLLAFDPDKPADYNQYLATPCRAADAFPVGSRAWSRIAVSNNSLQTAQVVAIDSACNDVMGCSTLTSINSYVMQNNVFAGFIDTNNPSGGSTPGLYFETRATPWVWNNNLSYNVTGTPSGSGNLWATNPLVTTLIPNISTFSGESNALSWNFQPTSSSPVLGAGVHNSNTPTTDYAGTTRPNPPSIGALELSTPTAATPTLTGGMTITGGFTIQ